MKNKLIIIIFGLGSTAAYAQQLEVIATTGNSGKNFNGSLEWTIGELTTETLTSQSNILTQGFHQTKLTITGIKEFTEQDLKIIAYPNPAGEIVWLSIAESYKTMNDRLQYLLYDQNGRLFETKIIESDITEILFSTLAPSTYFLKIIINDEKNQYGKSGKAELSKYQTIQIFKIVKL